MFTPIHVKNGETFIDYIRKIGARNLEIVVSRDYGMSFWHVDLYRDGREIRNLEMCSFKFFAVRAEFKFQADIDRVDAEQTKADWVNSCLRANVKNSSFTPDPANPGTFKYDRPNVIPFQKKDK